METRLYFAPTAPLADGARFSRLLTAVPPERRARALALRSPEARRLSLGAGLLLARALRDYGLSNAEIAAARLETDEHGRPFLPALPGFLFSLSHSAEHVLCAVSPAPVGCDLEGPRRVNMRLAERFFHPDERAFLRALPEPERPDAFLRLWTCKESYVKALGLGLAQPLDSFAVAFGAEGAALTRTPDGLPWRLRSFREGALYLALCGLEGVEGAPLERVEFD